VRAGAGDSASIVIRPCETQPVPVTLLGLAALHLGGEDEATGLRELDGSNRSCDAGQTMDWQTLWCRS
jgi:hypothetical protein